MRSPNWHECEVMLALDLYLNRDLSWLNKMSDSTFEIIALSKILNHLDFYSIKPEKFRSTGSIRMKLANFMALDDRYKKNSLDNVGSLDKTTWEKYSHNKDELHVACINILAVHLTDHNVDIDEYIRLMNLDEAVKNVFDKNFTNYIKQMRRALTYYSKLAEDNPDVLYSKEVLTWCKNVESSTAWIDKIEAEIDYSVTDVYIEHAGINMKPVKRRQNRVGNTEDVGTEKIGKLVQRTFNDLIAQEKLSDEMIDNLLEQKYSKENFGLKLPFLCLIDEEENIRNQLIDENGYVRYWTNPVEIHGKKYCVSKEWFENQRSRYLRWFASVDIKPFYMINTKEFKEILNHIKKIDSKNVCISKNELILKFSDGVPIEEIISILVDKGVLSGFQGSTKELVIDDYDAFYRMLNNPRDYALE